MSKLPYSVNWIPIPVMSLPIVPSCYFEIEGNMTSGCWQGLLLRVLYKATRLYTTVNFVQQGKSEKNVGKVFSFIIARQISCISSLESNLDSFIDDKSAKYHSFTLKYTGL